MGNTSCGPLCASKSQQNINDGTLIRQRSAPCCITGYPRRTSNATAGSLPQIVDSSALRAGTIGTGIGIEHFINGKTGVTIKGEPFIITGRPTKGMFIPKTGSTSVLFIYKKSNPKKLYRLDYDVLKVGPNAGQLGWEHNQTGVAKILDLKVQNHQSAGAWATAAGKSIKILRYGGKALIVLGLVESGLEIYYAPDRKGAFLTEAGGWVGAAGGAEIGADGGALVGAGAGAAVGVWFFGAGIVPGAAIGAVIGEFVGGIYGAYKGFGVGKAAVSYVYHRLDDQEEWTVVEPPVGVTP